MGHGASKEGDGVTSTTSTTTTDGSSTATTSTTTSTTTAGDRSNKRRHRPHFHSQSLIRQGSGKMMTPAATPASPTIRRPTTASVNSRIHAHTTDNNNNNNHRPVNRGGPTSPVARARAQHSPTPRVSPNRQRTGGGGTVQKVMKHDELYDLLESMGFPRSVVMETVERLQVRGQRTVIDANALIEQLLQSSRLYASSNVIDSDQLARRITELNRSRELSASRGSPLSVSQQTRSPAPYSPSPLRPSTSSVSSSVSSSSAASSDTSVSETAEIFDPFGLIGDNSASLPAPLSNAAAYNPFTNPNPQLNLNAMDTTPSTTSNALVPVAQPPPPPEEDDDSGKCKICYDRPIDTVILRCGHLAICLRCSKQLKDCPICRKPITEIVRIYQV